MVKFQQEHRAYKFQVAGSIVFHVAVNRQLLNIIEVCEQNCSGWVFSDFVSLQLNLWHLDPLLASALFQYPSGYKSVELLSMLDGQAMIA